MKNTSILNNNIILRVVFFLLIFFSNLRFCVLGRINVDYSVAIDYIYIIFVFSCFVLFYISGKNTIKDFIISIFLLAVGALVTIFSKNPSLLLSFIIMITVRNYCVRDVLKVDFVSKIICLLIVFLLCFVGVLGNVKIEKSIIGYSVVTNSLGFSSPNTLGIIILVLVIEYIYIFLDKLNVCKLIFIFLFSLVFYYLSCCRSLLYGSFILVFLTIFRKSSKFSLLSFVVIIFTILLSITLTYLYDKFSFIETIDSIFTHRFSLANKYTGYFDIKLFGNYIDFDGEKYGNIYRITLDNFYIRFLLNYGLISFILYSYFCLKASYVFGINKSIENNYNNIILIVLFIVGLTESSFYNFCFNPVFIIISSAVFSDISFWKIFIKGKNKLTCKEIRNERNYISRW